MAGSSAAQPSYLIGSDKKPWWLPILGVFIAIPIATGCWMQTESFVTLFDLPTHQSIQDHIKQSELIQGEIAKKSGLKPSKEKITYRLFNDTQQSQLEDAVKFVLSDRELETKLRDQFKISLKDVHAVVLPSWETNNKGYSTDIGITPEAGWSDFEQAAGSCSIGATTIRDKPGEDPRTLDGTPRIVLNVNAFAAPAWTRRVVFHELLHAMNIPGFRPSFFSRAQTDLIYLTEYRWFIAKANLKSWEEYLYRFFACFFWGVSVLSFGLFVRNHRRKRRGALFVEME